MALKKKRMSSIQHKLNKYIDVEIAEKVDFLKYEPTTAKIADAKKDTKKIVKTKSNRHRTANCTYAKIATPRLFLY